MRYKLMAVDIDGTLLNSSDIITEGTKKAIKAGVDNGLIFTISTGRPIQGVEPLIKELDIDLPFITYNGAMVVMGKSKEILYEQKLSAKDARDVYELGEKYGTTVAVWNNSKLYANKLDERVKGYSKISGVEPVLIEKPEEVLKDGATKILWYDEVEVMQKRHNEVGKYLSGNINYHTSKPYFLEFVDRNASKAIAMGKLGEHFSIKREEMIAVGDGFNDLSMIEFAGLGVAMSNANNAIKEKADFITLSNDEDGVAHVINRFVLKNI